MKKAAITGLVTLGILGAAACGTPQDGSDVIYYHRPNAGTGGAGGSTATSTTSTGVGGIDRTGTGGSFSTGVGGSGGSVPPGTGGVAGRPPFDGGSGGVPTRGGTYTEAVVEAEDSPPPIAGGTLAIVGQGHRAAVSDPDNDQVVVVDLDTMTIASTITLARGDEPGRLVEDGDGRLHVALRGGRGVAVLDPATSSVLGRLPVCGHPRGLAFDAGRGAIHVACVGGELVSYAASTGAFLRKLRLERDLRDVVIDGDRLLVSRFRAAELLVVESNGTVSSKISPPRPPTTFPIPRIAAVAWRTVASPDGGALMVYQLIGNSLVNTTPGGYGGSCGGIITTAISVLRTDGATATVDNIPAVLPVDVATNPTREVAVASAAWTPGATNPALGWFFPVTPAIPSLSNPRNSVACVSTGGPPPPPPPNVAYEAQPQGRVVALAYAPNNQLVFQTREPATVMFGDQTVALPGRSRKHTGHELFHLGTMGGLACASCHPEGQEDGQVWNFAAFGPRRTQAISGGIRGTEPFHWSGDMKDFSTLAHDVFNSRMTGPSLTDAHITSLLNWIDKIPRIEAPAVEDAAAVERGRALFNDSNVGCAGCHAGEKLTNNTTVSVGTSGAFQVPSLVGLAWRAPYMHTGCAPTLQGRFDAACGGGDAHGHTSSLTGDQIKDLIAYLDTL